MTKLSEVVDSKYGFAFRSAEFSEGAEDIRLLRGDNIGQGCLRWDSAKRFPVDRLSEVAGYELQVGDVVVAMDRPWIEAGLKYAVIRPEDLPCLLVQRVARLRAIEGAINPGFLGAIIGSPAFTNYVIGVQTGSAVPHISGRQVGDFEFDLPVPMRQKSIADILGALDDKIAANRRVIEVSSNLSAVLVVQHSARATPTELSEVTSSIVRGAAPKYAEEGHIVLNQKCIRDGRVDVNLARRCESLPKTPEKVLQRNDVLVNSTGQGTLGRAARWTRDDIGVTADSHVSIVRFDPECVDAVYAGTALSAMENEIAGLAEGSTGQTELRRDLLGSVMLRLPDRDTQRRVGAEIAALSSLADSLAAQNAALARTRDELLPLLMDGRISVRQAADTAARVL